MKRGPTVALLEGVFEVDETDVGAHVKSGYRGRKGSTTKSKEPVVALFERGSGRVRTTTMPK